MKRVLAATILFLFCLAPAVSSAASNTKSTVDMRNMNHIFVGWVDMNPESFAALGYDNKAEWVDLIKNLNSYFVAELKTEYLRGRTITGAKEKGDENAGGNDLYIKFTDVSVDHEYRLHVAIHFIDPKTNTEIASITNDRYTGRVCGLEGCLQKSLRKVGERLNKEITAGPGK